MNVLKVNSIVFIYSINQKLPSIYENKRILSDILFVLDEVSDISISAQDCKKINFNPMLSDFETVRDYCVLFLENSVSFNYKNDLKLFAFLLPMEYVFEDFIFGFINKEIEGVNPKMKLSVYNMIRLIIMR